MYSQKFYDYIKNDCSLCYNIAIWCHGQVWLTVFIYMIYSPGPPISSTNKTDHHDITEILLEVALNTLTLYIYIYVYFMTI
jgi:hypothetical protein